MPSRAARWISWMTSRLKIAPSRRPGRQPCAADRRSMSSCALPRTSNSVIGGQTPSRSDPFARGASVLPRVVDVEVVELAGGAVAAEVVRVYALNLGAFQEP